MRRLILSLSALASCLGAPAHAETSQDEQFWLNLTSMGSIKDDLVYFINFSPFLPGTYILVLFFENNEYNFIISHLESVFHFLTCGLIHWCRNNDRCKGEPVVGFRCLHITLDNHHQVRKVFKNDKRRSLKIFLCVKLSGKLFGENQKILQILH